MKKRLICSITMLTALIILLSGCSAAVPQYNLGDSIDISNNDTCIVTLKVEGAQEIGESQRISAGMAGTEGRAVAVDFSIMAISKENYDTYSFGYKLENQAGKEIEPGGYLEKGKMGSLVQNYSVVYPVGEKDQTVTFFAFNDKKAVGKVEVPISALTDPGKLEGFDLQARMDQLSFRFPDGYVVDEMEVPFSAVSPENGLVVEAWHFTGAKGKKEGELAEETFADIGKETGDISESTGVYSETWNGYDWLVKFDYSKDSTMKYGYMMTIKKDDYYVVRFSIPLSQYSGEMMDEIETIKNLISIDW